MAKFEDFILKRGIFLEEFEKILLLHFEKYPLMTPQDAVKLCYQSAFGCGHLVKNSETALSMLKNEMENITEDSDAQIFEPIGNGYIRLDLSAAKARGISYEKICEAFIKSANNPKITELEPKIVFLKKLSREGKTPFSEEELFEYLQEYNGEMVRHSEKYRKAYSPAYRVILSEYAKDLQ